MRKFTLVLIGLVVFGSESRAAFTYNAVRSVGTSGSVDLSITTDGKIGVLADADILDYRIVITDSSGSFTLLKSNSNFHTQGTAFTATANSLFFNFDNSGNQYVLVQATASPFGFYSVQTSGSFNPSNVPAEGVNTNLITNQTTYSPRSGNLVIATNAVPEPSTLAMTGTASLAGLGLARRRRSLA